ncbi:hypothetical protein [Sphingomonas sp. VNH70]|uniref:hypothetical protein n=1 Tax=Sphingomonas silueang TaxID=3156617 RepID=UPI0032B43C80
MALLDRVRERTGSDLSDTELLAMIAGIAGELDERLGPVGPITVDLGDPTDPQSGPHRTLRLNRPIGVGDVVVVEIAPGDSGAAGDAVTLSADDYRVLHGGRTLQRLSTGQHGRSHWSPIVRVTYTPAGPSQAARDEAIIRLMQIDLTSRGVLKSEKAGDYQASFGDTEAEREKVFVGLEARRGMVMA